MSAKVSQWIPYGLIFFYHGVPERLKGWKEVRTWFDRGKTSPCHFESLTFKNIQKRKDCCCVILNLRYSLSRFFGKDKRSQNKRDSSLHYQ